MAGRRRVGGGALGVQTLAERIARRQDRDEEYQYRRRVQEEDFNRRYEMALGKEIQSGLIKGQIQQVPAGVTPIRPAGPGEIEDVVSGSRSFQPDPGLFRHGGFSYRQVPKVPETQEIYQQGPGGLNRIGSVPKGARILGSGQQRSGQAPGGVNLDEIYNQPGRTGQDDPIARRIQEARAKGVPLEKIRKDLIAIGRDPLEYGL